MVAVRSGTNAEDFAALEDAEYAASVDFYRAAPAELRSRHGIGVHEVGGATCLTALDLEPASIFRRAAWLGVHSPTDEAELDAVLAQMDRCGQRYVIPVATGSRPPELAGWLERRGFARGYAWMKFSRPCAGVAPVATNLEVRLPGTSQGAEFGHVVTAGFGMPPELAPWLAALPGRPDWLCVMAYDGVHAVAAGAAYVHGEYAWLGFGATLPDFRRRGAQNALLARRLSEAAAHGARVAVTETGERQSGKPSHSYRNILRAGFEEKYLRQNYLSRAIS